MRESLREFWTDVLAPGLAFLCVAAIFLASAYPVALLVEAGAWVWAGLAFGVLTAGWTFLYALLP